MQYLTLAIASIFALASQATAQVPDVPQCLMGCFNDASSSAGCSGGMDLQCMCTNEKFTNAAMACIINKCSAEDQAAAAVLNQQFCAPFTGNSTTASGSATGTSAPAASTSTSAGYSTGINMGLLAAGAGIALFSL
ncbi:unnamed protein product [Rhizoctonia solani]|uniref:CFEM domain-containing protein n=1 Tax=Rhizoctonia solani TaxID=456999 RepID=A0A8H3HCB5_9AGAM|nr:unnamed protein product [Rhizoctonia solani]